MQRAVPVKSAVFLAILVFSCQIEYILGLTSCAFPAGKAVSHDRCRCLTLYRLVGHRAVACASVRRILLDKLSSGVVLVKHTLSVVELIKPWTSTQKPAKDYPPHPSPPTKRRGWSPGARQELGMKGPNIFIRL